MTAARMILGALLVLGARAQQISPAAQGKKPAITGTVTSARTGLPLKKAHVTLQSPKGEDHTDTDAEGSFSFRDLEPGTYYIRVDCQGYVESHGGKNVTVATEQSPKKLEFKLLPHGIISGRVLDEDGQPLAWAGVTVLISRFDARIHRRLLIPAGGGVTDDLGHFRAWGLKPGRYFVKADYGDRSSYMTPDPQAPDAPGEGFIPTFYPGVDDSGQAAAVEVASGLETAGIDIKLIRSRIYRVRGRVLGADGEPPRNTMVNLLRRDAGPGYEAHRQAVSAAGGAFEIASVTPGAYRLEVFQYPEEFFASEDVDVSDRNVTGVVLRLGSGFELSGRATVKDRPDFHFEGGHVSLWLSGENWGRAFARFIEDGTFTMHHVRPGRYRVQAWAGPSLKAYLISARVGQDDISDEVDLRHAPDPAARLELVFSARPAVVKGGVTDEHNKPVPGAQVVLLPDPDHRDQAERYGVAVADQDGRYALTIRPGEYHAVALEGFEPDEWMDPAVAGELEKRAVKVSLGEAGSELRDLKVISREVP